MLKSITELNFIDAPGKTAFLEAVREFPNLYPYDLWPTNLREGFVQGRPVCLLSTGMIHKSWASMPEWEPFVRANIKVLKDAGVQVVDLSDEDHSGICIHWQSEAITEELKNQLNAKRPYAYRK